MNKILNKMKKRERELSYDEGSSENDQESEMRPKIVISERKDSQTRRKQQIERLRRVKENMKRNPAIMKKYGMLKTDKEKLQFIGKYI